jgi:hypothetical protein
LRGYVPEESIRVEERGNEIRYRAIRYCPIGYGSYVVRSTERRIYIRWFRLIPWDIHIICYRLHEILWVAGLPVLRANIIPLPVLYQHTCLHLPAALIANRIMVTEG